MQQGEFSVSIVEGDKTIDCGASQTYTAKAVYAPFGKTIGYKWYVDAVEQTETSASFSFSATPSAKKSYVIKVKATAGDSSAEASVTCTVQAPGAPSKEEAVKACAVFQSILTTVSMAQAVPASLPATLTVAEKSDKTGSTITAVKYVDTVCGTGYTASGWMDIKNEGQGASFTYSFDLSLSGGSVKRVSSEGLTCPAGGSSFDGSFVVDGTTFKYVDLFPPPAAKFAVSIIEGDQTIDNGSIAIFTATVSGLGEGASVSYAWSVDGVEQAGKTTASFGFSASPDAEKVYTIKVAATSGDETATANVTCTVKAVPVVPFVPCCIDHSSDLKTWTPEPGSPTTFTVAGGVLLNDRLLLREKGSRKYYSFDSASQKWSNTGIVAPEGAKLEAALGAGKFLCLTEGNALWLYDGSQFSCIPVSPFPSSANITGFGEKTDPSISYFYIDSDGVYAEFDAKGIQMSTKSYVLPQGIIQALSIASGFLCLTSDGKLIALDTQNGGQSECGTVPAGSFLLILSSQGGCYALSTKP